ERFPCLIAALGGCVAWHATCSSGIAGGGGTDGNASSEKARRAGWSWAGARDHPSVAILRSLPDRRIPSAREAAHAGRARGRGRYLPEVRYLLHTPRAALVHRVGGVVRGVRHGVAVRLREHLRGPRPRAGVHPHGPRPVARGSAGGVVVLGEGRALPLPSCERPPPLHHGPRRRV